jgi:hypothetical protein
VAKARSASPSPEDHSQGGAGASLRPGKVPTPPHACRGRRRSPRAISAAARRRFGPVPIPVGGVHPRGLAPLVGRRCRCRYLGVHQLRVLPRADPDAAPVEAVQVLRPAVSHRAGDYDLCADEPHNGAGDVPAAPEVAGELDGHLDCKDTRRSGGADVDRSMDNQSRLGDAVLPGGGRIAAIRDCREGCQGRPDDQEGRESPGRRVPVPRLLPWPNGPSGALSRSSC